jgi:hypothetical protein
LTRESEINARTQKLHRKTTFNWKLSRNVTALTVLKRDGDLEWLDALLNASMILGGMGPVAGFRPGGPSPVFLIPIPSAVIRLISEIHLNFFNSRFILGNLTTIATM